MSAETPTTETRLREAQAALKLRAVEAQTRLLDRYERRLRESADPWLWTGGDVRVVDRLQTSAGLKIAAHISTAQDRRYGDNAPFWRSWQEHARLRAGARLLYGLSPLCSGIVRGLCAYAIGEGFTYQAVARKGRGAPPELVEAVQDVIEDFDRRNCWSGRQVMPGYRSRDPWESELFVRTIRDGEAIVREFEPEPGRLVIRPVEPEWIIEPYGMREEVSYGVLTDPEDLLTVNGYFVSMTGAEPDGEEVPPAREGGDLGIHFLSVNTDSTIKRGMPDLAYGTHDALRSAGKLLENVSEGAAIQAAIAMIRQHANSNKDEVVDFAASLKDYDRTNPITGNTERVESYQPGMILDVPQGQEHVMPAFGQNQQAFIGVIQAVLRSLGVRWNAPEWLVSGDASNNNYASSLTAEAPLVKSIKKEQSLYRGFYCGVVWRAVEIAASAGRIVTDNGRVWSWQEVRRLVDIQATPPTVETRNRGEEATLNQTYVGMGVKSPQTVQAEQGLDPDQEAEQIEEWRRRFGQQGAQLPDQGDQGGGFFGVQEGDRRPFELREAGFTGEKKDSRGHRICYKDGKRIPCGDKNESGGEAGNESVDDLVDKMGMVGPGASPETVQEISASLSRLGRAELAQVKQRLGLTQGGKTNAERVKKLTAEATKRINDREKWSRQARAAGVRPRDMISTANEMRGIQREHVNTVKDMIRSARRMYQSDTGTNLTRNHPAFRGGDLDSIQGFDEIAASMSRQYPEILGSDPQEAGQRLYDYIAAGTPRLPPRADNYKDAVEYLQGQPKPGDAAEPAGGDVSFDFGAMGREPEQGDTGFDFGANAPKEEASREEVPNADAWRQALAQAGLSSQGAEAVLGQMKALQAKQSGTAKQAPAPASAPETKGELPPDTKPAGNGQRVAKDGTVWARAPAGGAESPVNGQKYRGGQWMPIHGMSPKREKGAKPKAKGQAQARGEGEGGGRPERKPLTAEQARERQQEMKRQAQVDDIQQSPLGTMFKLGYGRSLNFGGRYTPGYKNWFPFAKEIGNDGLKELANHIKPIVDRVAATDPEGPEAFYQWNIDRQAEDDAGYAPKKPQRDQPEALRTMWMLGTALENANMDELHGISKKMGELSRK